MSTKPGSAITADILDSLAADLGNAETAYLRSNGWDYNCNYPGSYWLWSKPIPISGVAGVKWQQGTFTMNTATAVRTQRAIDAWFNPDHGDDIGG